MHLDFSRKLSDSFAYFSAPEVAKRLFFAVTFIKILGYLIFVYSGAQFWTPVTDANLYDAIARGVVVQDHPWGGLLKTMNDHGLYSRTYISAFIFTLNCALVPWLVSRLCVPTGKTLLVQDWYLLIAVAFYPTMTIYSADIFRDIVMVVLFLCFAFGVQYFLTQSLNEWKLQVSSCWLLAILVCGYMLFTLRFYLAAALFMALVASSVLNFQRRWWVLAICYFVGLWIANLIGVFDYLKGGYRLTYQGAGSGYDINFAQGIFLLNFLQSFLYSIFGIYLYNLLSVVVFVVESIPVLVLLIYIYVNRQYGNRYTNFFLSFFFIYAALWVIGVDSLGTAVRYRIFNYLAVLIAAGLIYRRKFSTPINVGDS